MALNTFKCNCLTPLHFKGLMRPLDSYRKAASFHHKPNSTAVFYTSVSLLLNVFR